MKKKQLSESAPVSKNESLKNPAVVVGEGWGALMSAALLTKNGRPLVWVSGESSRFLAPLPFFDGGLLRTDLERAELTRVCRALSDDAFEVTPVSMLREFKNKSFRAFEYDEETFAEMWNGESHLLRGSQAERVECPEVAGNGVTLAQLESALRESTASLPKSSGVTVSEVLHVDGQVVAVKLSTGERIETDTVIFADAPPTLHFVQGLPKPISFFQGFEEVGILQVSFTHKSGNWPQGQAFRVALNRDPGETFQRHVWGYFYENSAGELKSVWTLFFEREEAEDNHEIAKKLKKLKTTVDKMFTTPGLLEEAGISFLNSIEAGSESFRFEEDYFFCNGKAISDPQTFSSVEGLWILTDSFGPTAGFLQVAKLLDGGIFKAASGEQNSFTEGSTSGTNPEAENIHLANADTV